MNARISTAPVAASCVTTGTRPSASQVSSGSAGWGRGRGEELVGGSSIVVGSVLPGLCVFATMFVRSSKARSTLRNLQSNGESGGGQHALGVADRVLAEVEDR